MPTLPKTTVSRLKDVKPGSLVSARDPSGTLVFGLRVSTGGHQEDPEEPALVVLSPRDNAIDATVIPNRGGGGGWMANGNTRVVDHGHDFSIHVHAQDWDADLRQRNFAPADAGLLLLSESDGLSLAVSVPYTGGCDVLNLKTWVLDRPSAGARVAAKVWRLSLPWVSSDTEWPLGALP